jgi:hypothetical protein
MEDKNTRYYIDINTETKGVIGWNCGQRNELILEKQEKPIARIYITKGQNKQISKIKNRSPGFFWGLLLVLC